MKDVGFPRSFFSFSLKRKQCSVISVLLLQIKWNNSLNYLSPFHFQLSPLNLLMRIIKKRWIENFRKTKKKMLNVGFEKNGNLFLIGASFRAVLWQNFSGWHVALLTTHKSCMPCADKPFSCLEIFRSVALLASWSSASRMSCQPLSFAIRYCLESEQWKSVIREEDVAKRVTDWWQDLFSLHFLFIAFLFYHFLF